MKRTLILIFLLTCTITSLITAASCCYVSGNTFTIPSGNKENNPYHTYNIDNINNKTDKHQNRKNNNNIQKDNHQAANTNNNTEVKHFYNNTEVNKNKNIISPSKPAKKASNKTRKKTSRKRAFKKHNPNTITKIEFQNHFIKIKAGSSKNILFKTNPEKSSHTGMFYKSYNKSVAVYNNNKLTAIKKGFTTILIMVKDGTVKAACPVKVI